MRRRRLFTFTFAYREVATVGDEVHSVELHVEADSQPKAEQKADAEYREYFAQKARLNWNRLRRDLVRVSGAGETA